MHNYNLSSGFSDMEPWTNLWRTTNNLKYTDLNDRFNQRATIQSNISYKLLEI